MDKQNRSKSTLFLMELILVIFFFSICSVICVNVFASARQMAEDSHALSSAVMVARSGASCYKAAEGDVKQTMALLEENGGPTNDSQTEGSVYYNKDWQQTTEAESRYCLTIRQTAQPGEAEITVTNSTTSEQIFRLMVKAGRGEAAV